MNVYLGLHECDLCPEEQAPQGNGEVRIPSEPSVASAAPFLITHYITVHRYRPPQVFIDAVLAVDLDAWPATRWPDVPHVYGQDPVPRAVA